MGPQTFKKPKITLQFADFLTVQPTIQIQLRLLFTFLPHANTETQQQTPWTSAADIERRTFHPTDRLSRPHGRTMVKKHTDVHGDFVKALSDPIPKFTDVFDEETFYIFAAVLVVVAIIGAALASRYLKVNDAGHVD